MNAVEIEEAISALAEQPFDAAEFPFAFLLAFGNKETTIKRLRAGSSNKSDLGGVLQVNNIHIKTCAEGQATATLRDLRESPATTRAKAKFILATDGVEFQAEDLTSDDPPLICPYADFPNHFGFFLPLAGITTVRAIRESAFDIRATSRLNRLYIELLKDNPDWGAATRRHDMNQFMARLIFCFFAEDTGIFAQETIFTRTIDTMSARDSSNTHEVIGTLFRAMNTRPEDRAAQGIPRWAEPFPYVNGELFSGTTEAPRFSRIARSYLLTIGGLDWTQVNPDIFGSMIQAVADEEERGALGMHYTSVPNILKVLNPLFLDDLRMALEEAGDNGRKLLNLRTRMARIRVFDPACGSGNFLVIAYKELRAIEAEINRRRGEADRRSEITLTNFRGIELKDFPATIARLALIIAEYQCDVLHRGQREATRDFLPLDSKNWITCGNALRLDWLSICPPTGAGVKMRGDDLFSTPLDQAEIDFENEGGETYICGNPPYKGASEQEAWEKEDLAHLFDGITKTWKVLDYVSGWFVKAAEYGKRTESAAAFVSTNSICQGQQVPTLWPLIMGTGHEIAFAHTNFRWKNLAQNNAGVTVVVVGIKRNCQSSRMLYAVADSGETVAHVVSNINPYLISFENIYVVPASEPRNGLSPMDYGSKPADGGGLVMNLIERDQLKIPERLDHLAVPYIGSAEYIDGKQRFCLWIEDKELEEALSVPAIRRRIDFVRAFRSESKKRQTREAASASYAFLERRRGERARIVAPLIIPIHTSETREFLPVGCLPVGSVISNAAFGLYDAPLWNMALIASRLHLVWIATVCGKLETRYRYSNTLGWNTFPVPLLTEKQKSDLTACAEAILLAREAHFPATIADLYDPENMPDNLRAAHDRNDETLERIYIGRRFRNDTERLEHLFSLYSKMTAKGGRDVRVQ
ncbi:MAG: lactate dehydrogenase [Gemmobacter sp.]|jgi:hypothetical protein|nr:lactate dehydrogenase [Gemmobacter sp.]